MESPNCEVCGGKIIINSNDDYECIYCGTITDENGDVVYEIQSM